MPGLNELDNVYILLWQVFLMLSVDVSGVLTGAIGSGIRNNLYLIYFNYR